MTNHTDTYWSVDGQSLETYAFAIETLGGDRLAPPGLRGANSTIPGRPGEVWQPKTPESRVLSLAMWVIGTDEDGNRPLDGDIAQQFNKNFRKLRRLLWTPRRQITLQKRFRDEDGVLRTVSAKAQFVGGLNPTMNGRARGAFIVDLYLADPYFYDDNYTSVSLTTGTATVNVPGDDRTNEIKLTFPSARTNPRVSNNTAGLEFTYTGAMPSGVTVFEVPKFDAINSSNDYSGNVTHKGSPFWLGLDPGANAVQLSSSSGSGTVTLQYKAVWL